MVESIIPTAGFSSESLMRGILGMAVLVGIAYGFSHNRKAINWKIVGIGLLMQLILAIGVLYVTPVKYLFEFVGQIFINIMDFTQAGTSFLFKSFVTGEVESALTNFAVNILPTIIFFSALTSVLFYMGIIQKIVKALAWVMTKALKISGAESLSVAGNIFLGQTEAPLMIKKYLEKMNNSEILLVMIGGMATVAGGVLAAYVGFLGGEDQAQKLFYAKHLLAASVMAAPGAIVVAKMLYPQTEEINSNVEVSNESVGSNFLDALANGTTEGLKLAMNVGAMLLVFFAFLAMMNFILKKFGAVVSFSNLIFIIFFAGLISLAFKRYKTGYNNYKSFAYGLLISCTVLLAYLKTGLVFFDFKIIPAETLNGYIQAATSYDGLTLQFLLGYLFSPLMWLIGVAVEDMALLGQLLGVKIIASEFVGYEYLANFKDTSNAVHLTYQKSILMATYMLCGFANFASIGIQVGGIGSLAPSKRKILSKFGMRALLGGTIASLFSATMAGMLLG
ncbi:MAG: Na+ dependent nucleoside transporter [Proteobacteria bacterium]|nr:Na+ dependent nucleoside transporter [Pseudomonadota bacterium]